MSTPTHNGPKGWLLLHTPFITVLFCFFVSGGCGLLYQVIWTRKLVLLFGATSYAVSTVLSVFFMGLALGSYWGGRLADKSPRPLWIYGCFEILIGFWALAFIFLVDWGESGVVAILRATGGTRAIAIALRALLATVFLIVPATLMGATLPLLSRYVTGSTEVRGRPIGGLYTLNTLGAVFGCAITGFLLLANLGYIRTTLVGAMLNVGVGILALVLYRSAGPALPQSTPAPHGGEEGTARSSVPPVIFLVVAAFALSGFCSIALEVLWTRLLATILLGTTYAFATMLTTVLCGIAAGSAVASLIIDRIKHRVAFFGLAQVATAAACLWALGAFPDLPERLGQYRIDLGYDWNRLVLSKFFLSFSVLFPPTFFFGMSFPIAVRAVAASRSPVGAVVGRLYMANTLGGVAGALAGGYAIIPLVGTHTGILILAAAMAVMGLLLVLACPTLPRFAKPIAIGGSLAIVLFMGAKSPPDVGRALNHSFIPDGDSVLYYAEGIEGTVVVSGPAEDGRGVDRVLWINGVPATASIEKGVKMNRFQGVLPLLFDREPQKVLFMCFGSGVTAGTLALSPFTRIDAVEISPEVLEAASLFKADNFDVADNGRVNFIVDDGRNFLLTTDNTYGLITFEPMPLALAGVSTFYTEEYYRLCLGRLAPGGLVSQWVPLHSLNDSLVRSLVGTFVHVFPYATAWFVNADIFLIGSDEPLVLDFGAARRSIQNHPTLALGLQRVYLGDLFELYASFLMGRPGLVRYSAGAQIMTDDRPWAEFVAPKLVHEHNVVEALAAIEPFMESPLPYFGDGEKHPGEDAPKIERRFRAHVQDLKGLKIYYAGGMGMKPEVEFRKALAIDPGDQNARYYLGEVLLAKAQRALRFDQHEEAIAMLIEARTHAPHRLDLILALADAYFEAGLEAEATRTYALYIEGGGGAKRAKERRAS